MHVLVIDDEQSQREILRDILTAAGYTVTTAGDGEQGMQLVQREEIQIVLSDLKMPNKDGFGVLREVMELNPDIQVIIMTAFGTIPSAVNAIKSGAYDYLTKPFKKDELLRVLQRAAERFNLLQENRRLQKEVSNRFQYQNILGKSPAIREIFSLIERIRDIDATVLISGESGTGKELVARAIHFSGKRQNGPFIAINCGAIPDTLIESELFGHEKGSFTGADKSYTGKFEQAQGGTIFLDEIGTMRLDLQIRLLRVLQDKKIERIGSTRSIDLDIRVLAASNENLQAKLIENKFRADLYHRLNVFHIHLPPLRERKGDLPLLANHFLNKYAVLYSKPDLRLSKSALRALEAYHFPGNVRELENIIEKTIILSDKPLVDDRDLLMPSSDFSLTSANRRETGSLPEIEEKLIVEALKESQGSIKRASRKLGITYKTLQYRLKKLNIDKNHYKAF